ncbi:MAG TPA: ABC transporter permease [Terriglobia bacterium]|nr:ABC transporter permease [Terriglobia bacterium]
MAIPLKYNLRNLAVRRTTTAMTAFSITLTVTVFVVLMALAQGLQVSLTATGHPLNLLILREGSQSETQSSVQRDSLQVIRYLDGIAKTENGEPWVSPELIVLINLPRRGQVQGSNVSIRGLGPEGFAMRPEFKLVEGRQFRPGLREVIVSKKIADRFQNCGLGEKLKFAKGYWTVVGIFDAGSTAYASEIWTDAEDLGQDFDRDAYSSVLVRATDATALARLKKVVSDDRRLHMKPQTEKEYYESQTSTAAPIKALGIFIAGLMAVGASFAAMNTMYAAVARRTKEIGVLRVVGFSRRSILLSFIIESVLIAALGGFIGCVLALPVNGVTTGTTNFMTFSELTFDFRITLGLLVNGMIFAVVMGFVGGLFPAWRAAHEDIVTALRSA